MSLALGSPRCVMIVAPHPDDETIGAFGLLSLLRRQGAEIRVLIVSDGGASHRNSPTWPKTRLVRERRRETLRAMAIAGVTKDRIRFLYLPDGGLPDAADACRRLVSRELRCARRLDLVVGPTPDDNHADHRVVADAIGASRLPGVRRLGYQVWPAAVRRPKSRAIRLDAATRRAKRRALAAYRTQTGRITNDPAGFAMSLAHITCFTRPQEAFRIMRP